MNTLTKRQQEQIFLERKATIIVEANPGKNIFNDVLPMIFQMQKWERRLQKLAEHSCNGYPMPKIEYRDGKMFHYSVEDVKWRERCEKEETRLEKRITELAKEFNLVPVFQGDPRGVMFTLKTPDGREISL